MWEYSEKAMQLIQQYKAAFPELFEVIYFCHNSCFLQFSVFSHLSGFNECIVGCK